MNSLNFLAEASSFTNTKTHETLITTNELGPHTLLFHTHALYIQPHAAAIDLFADSTYSSSSLVYRLL